MTDSEKEREANLRLALEEANRYFRHIDNYLWIISSALLFFTFYILKESMDWIIKERRLEVFSLFILIMLLWELYIGFLKNACLQGQRFLSRINDMESKLKIDVVPYNSNDGKNEDKQEDEKLSTEMFGNFVKARLDNIKSKRFPEVILYVRIIVYAAIIALIIYNTYLTVALKMH